MYRRHNHLLISLSTVFIASIFSSACGDQECLRNSDCSQMNYCSEAICVPRTVEDGGSGSSGSAGSSGTSGTGGNDGALDASTDASAP